MKVLALIVAASQLAAASPHGPGGGMASPPPAPAAPAAPPAPAAGQTQSKTTTPAGCKKIPSDADWPSEAEWKKVLPELVTRPKNLPAGVYRPDYKVRAESVADVQAAVKFCAQNNIRLTIINSGHDFLGRNDAPTGLSLDTSLLGGIKVLESFTPSAAGAEKPGKTVNTIVPVPGKQAAVTFGVGLTTQRLNNALSPSKLVSVGAAHGSVAPAGGYGQTSGHSPISNRYGLGSDQFLEFKVVTPDGELKIANSVSNQDLFWALRGGGGSTFGVVVEATMKAHPDIPITISNWQFNVSQPNIDGLWDAYSYLHTQFLDLSDNHGVSGYYYLYPSRMTGVFLHQAENSGKDKVKKIWDPILAKMSSFSGNPKLQLEVTEYPNFKSYFDARFGSLEGGMKGAKMPWDVAKESKMMKRHGPGTEMSEPVPNSAVNLDSRLLGAEALKNPKLTAYLKAASPFALPANQSIIQGHLTGGGKVLRPDDDTSVLPAWRKAYTHVIAYKVPGKASVDSLRELAPNMGAYVNEAFPLEENWKQSFWGSNYEKLSQIKSKYDPNMLLWTTPGINADLMEVRDGVRVCKVEKKVDSKEPPRSDNLNSGRIMSGTIN